MPNVGEPRTSCVSDVPVILLQHSDMNISDKVALQGMNLPSFDFLCLKGHIPARYTVHVNAPWCITFEFRDGDAYVLDFEQYH